MKKMTSGGGWAAIRYTFRKAREVGGVYKLYQAMRTKNACKTCALGMGGQKGGMVNERGSFPEFCKKSLQAMTSDMQPAITAPFWQQNSIAEMQTWSPYQLERCGRLIQPVLFERGQSHYKTITWSEAFDRIASKLLAIQPDESFWYFSGRSSNEAGFLLQLLARVYGTNNVNNCSYYCHQASGVGLGTSLGTGTATVVLDDVEKCDLVFVIGGNPPSNHPRLMTSLMHLRRRGGKVIVINPVRELGMVKFRIPSDPRSLFFGTKIASHYIQPHIGGDLALLAGIAKAVDELGKTDIVFLKNYTSQSEAYLEYLRGLSWEEICRKSGVERSEIKSIAELYAAAKNVVFGWTMGITHHTHGVENVQAIVNLALMRGQVGRPGAGLMPIRGHSNVQGIGSVGVTPKLKDQIFDNLQKQFGVRLPTTAGLDTMACMEQAMAKNLKFGFCLGGNLYGSNPDSTYANRAMESLEMNVMLSTTLNTGHVHGLADQTIILPVLARDEEPEPTTQESMFNYVRLSDGGPARVPGPRSEVAVIAELGKRIFSDARRGESDLSFETNRSVIDWGAMQQTQTIRHWISKVVPGYGEVESIAETKKEFHIPGRTFHEPKFSTSDGLARLFCHTLPELSGEGTDQLRLMTVRSEGQFNTVVYEETDIYRGQDRRDVILLHPDDIGRLGLNENDRVVVSSQVGELRNILVRSFPEIRSGNALMYYPEANVLVPRTLDPQSKTPAFKSVLIQLARQIDEQLPPKLHTIQPVERQSSGVQVG